MNSDTIKVNEKTIIYGMGKRGLRLAELIPIGESAVLLDSSPEKAGHVINEHEILLYSDSCDVFENAKRICITIADEAAYADLKEELSKHNIPFVTYIELMTEYIHKLVGRRFLSTKVSAENVVVIAVYASMGFGGLENWVCDLAEDLASEGYKVRVATMTPEVIEHPQIKENIDLICDSTVTSYRNQVESMLDYLDEKQPTALITTQADLFLYCAKALNQYSHYAFKTIASIHGYGTSIIHNYADLFFSNLLYVGCAEEIPVALEQEGIPKANTCNMQVPFLCNEHLCRSYTVEENSSIKLGWAGRMVSMDFTDQKRLDNLLMYAQYLKEAGLDFILEIAGEGPAKKEFESKVEECKLTKNVHMLGYIERTQIHEFWKKQDVCVLSSDLEGRSISVLEAMGNGAVPIVTAVSGVREDIRNGYNGFIVEIGDYQALAEKTIYLAEHRELLEIMGNRAHDIIYPKSKRDTHKKFWIDLIESGLPQCTK